MRLHLALNDGLEAQDRINRRVYHAKGVDRIYRRHELHRVETLALLQHQPCFAGRDVLDIGVGTGRTAHYLAPPAIVVRAMLEI